MRELMRPGWRRLWPPHLLTPPIAPDIVSTLRLEGRISLHDRHQFEITFHYGFDPTHPKIQYRVDAYFFVPPAVGITAETYDPEQFFCDTQAYLRWDTPRAELSELLQTDAPALWTELQQALGDPSRADETVLQQARLTGCVIRSALRRQRRKILQAILDQNQSIEKLSERTRRFISQAEQLLSNVRKLFAQGESETLCTGLGHINDMLSIVAIECCCELFEALTLGAQNNCPPALLDCRKTIEQFLSTEGAYRTQHGWPTACPDSSADELEHMVYRRSALKKYIFTALFLKVRRLKTRNLTQHLFGAIGACIAAVWAFFSNPSLFGSVTINSFTFAILFVAVFAYILKDRMKELTRQMLAQRFRRLLPDRDRQILPSDWKESRQKVVIGRLREYIDFTNPAQLEPALHHIRNAVHWIDVDEEMHEEVLHYGKRIDLWPQRTQPVSGAIKDILRFNVRHLLTRLDESGERIHGYDQSAHRVVPVEAQHVYHVNLVMRYLACDPQGNPGPATYERIRLILNKAGIVRIEPVVLDTAQQQVEPE